MMGWYGGGLAAAMWVVMGLFWLVLIAAIVWLAIMIARTGRHAPTSGSPAPWSTTTAGPGQATTQGPSPLEVLDHRLASGEIDLATYQQVRAALIASRGMP